MKIAAWKSATVYHLRDPLLIDQIAGLPAWRPPIKGHDSVGIVPIYGDELATPLGNSGCWFRLRTSGRKVSKSEQAFRIAAAVDQHADDIGDDYDVRNRIVEEVKTKLREETPPTHTEYDLMFRGEWFIVCSGSEKVCDYVTGWLRAHLSEHLSLQLAKLDGGLSDLGINLFKRDVLAVDNLCLGSRVKVKLKDNTVVQVSSLAASPELTDVLRMTKEVLSFEVEWRSQSAKIKEDLTLSCIDDGFDPDQVEFEQDDEAEYDDGERRYLESRARAELFVTDMPLLIKDVALHCGGLSPVKSEDEQA